MKSKQHIPRHVGIIMDGNRRWARKHHVPALVGHQRGYEQAIKIAEHAFTRGVKFLTLYAFSTENWNRSRDEVTYLMRLCLRFLSEQTDRLHRKGIRLRIIGSRSKLDKKLLHTMEEAQEKTHNNKKGTVLIAFNYGGRQEITHAVRSIVKAGYSWDAVTEAMIGKQLTTHGVPDPDFIIRTSGELRLSGFLLWQAAYSELYFTPKLWPEFDARDFDAALDEFGKRARRFGS